jgi:hypothetical protein
VVGAASITSVGGSVPPAGGGAGAESGSVDEGEVLRADTLLTNGIIVLVGGAGLTSLGEIIEVLGSGAEADSVTASMGSGGAADLAEAGGD